MQRELLAAEDAERAELEKEYKYVYILLELPCLYGCTSSR